MNRREPQRSSKIEIRCHKFSFIGALKNLILSFFKNLHLPLGNIRQPAESSRIDDPLHTQSGAILHSPSLEMGAASQQSAPRVRREGLHDSRG